MTTKLTTKLMIRLGTGVDRPEFLEAVDNATDSDALVLVAEARGAAPSGKSRPKPRQPPPQPVF